MKIRNLILMVIAILILSHKDLNAQQEMSLQKKVDDYLNVYLQMNLFSGSVLIAEKGQVLAKGNYGYANAAFDIGNSMETKFRLGSLTKVFTAVAILQLVDEGKLKLNDPLSKFISDYPGGTAITVENLLTHSSGIPNHTEFEDFNGERRVYLHTLAQTINTFKNKTLNFSPGEKTEYSNSNYILLGYILEKVRKMSYEECILQYITEPLGMRNTGYEHPDKMIKEFANGYILRNNELQNSKYRDMSNAHASGALYSTTSDLYLLDRALYTNTLISERSRKLMNIPFKDNFTCGWGTASIFDHEMVSIAGRIEGCATNFSRFCKDSICIIILSNFENAPINRINRDLIALVFNQDYSAPDVEKTIALAETTLKAFAGTYELKPGFNFKITFEEKRLFCQPTKQPKLEMFAVSGTDFLLIDVPAHIEFELDSEGNSQKLILKQGKSSISAARVNR